jgi:hypothetical protein
MDRDVVAIEWEAIVDPVPEPAMLSLFSATMTLWLARRARRRTSVG